MTSACFGVMRMRAPRPDFQLISKKHGVLKLVAEVTGSDRATLASRLRKNPPRSMRVQRAGALTPGSQVSWIF